MVELFEFFKNLSGGIKLTLKLIFAVLIIMLFLKTAHLIYIEQNYCVCAAIDHRDVIDGIHVDEYEECMKPID